MQVETLLCLTLKALVLLQPEDLADVLDAARRELIAVFSHLVRGLREHQVPAFADSGAKVPAVRALVVLQQRQNTGAFKWNWFKKYIYTVYISSLSKCCKNV